MSQFDFGAMDPDTIDGTELANILSQWRDAVHSAHKGPSAPTYAAPGMRWLDDNTTPWVLRKCVAVTPEVAWAVMGTVDPEGPTFTPAAHGHAVADVAGLQDALDVLPAIEAGDANKMLRVRDDETGYEHATAAQVRAAMGPDAPTDNLVVNPDFSVNQRGYAGAALGAGDYGHDMWRAATGGCTYTEMSGVVTISAGGMGQELVAPDLASETVTVSALVAAGASVSVQVQDEDAVVLDNTGGGSAARLSATFDLDAGDTGNIVLKLAKDGASTCSFSRVKLEIGGAATTFVRPNETLELAKCQRYFTRFTSVGSGTYIGSGYLESLTRARIRVVLPVEMPISGTAVSFTSNMRAYNNVTSLNTTVTNIIFSYTSSSHLNGGTLMSVVDLLVDFASWSGTTGDRIELRGGDTSGTLSIDSSP